MALLRAPWPTTGTSAKGALARTITRFSRGKIGSSGTCQPAAAVRRSQAREAGATSGYMPTPRVHEAGRSGQFYREKKNEPLCPGLLGALLVYFLNHSQTCRRGRQQPINSMSGSSWRVSATNMTDDKPAQIAMIGAAW